MMTKQEERAALAKIEKILKTAGPDSYVGMAFAGCCELARTNIENDFGCSMQDNINTWKRNAEKEHEMRVQCQELIEELNKKIDRHIAEKDQLRDQIKEAQDKTIPDDLLNDVLSVMEDQLSAEDSRVAHCVDILAAFADCPRDIAVAEALKGLSAAKAQKKMYSQLIERLNEYMEV